MENYPHINILLSTYNGEKFLVQQLDSIFNQTYQNFSLYIRDDGSSDSTVKLIESYFQEHPSFAQKTFFIQNPQKINLGYMEAFWTLLDCCEKASYYAFCDQDDVWLKNKLQAGISFLEKEAVDIPLLYFSNYMFCDENLNPLHSSTTVPSFIHFKDVLFYTPAFGFSIIINDTLRSLALQTTNRKSIPHDGWVQKIAAAFGKIIYNKECTAYYRRHSNAVTSSNAHIVSTLYNWFNQDLLGTEMRKTHFILHRFYQEYGNKLSPSNTSILNLFACNSFNIQIWLKRIFFPLRLRPSLAGELALRICFLFNRY